MIASSVAILGVAPHERFEVGVEYNWLETQSKGAAMQTAHHFNVGAALEF